MDDDIEIFKGKQFSDLCKDIYTNSQHTRNQIEILISEVRGQIKDVNSALALIPQITDLLDSGIKNDDHLVKLAAIVTRVMANNKTVEAGGTFELTDEERQQLMAEVENVQKSVIESKETKKLEDNEADTDES